MYKKFVISEIKTAAFDKKITVVFNFALDEKTVSTDSLMVCTLAGDHVEFTYSVNSDVVTITLKEWPQVNTVYQLIVDGTVANIAGDTLESSIRRKIIFKSAIRSKVTIKSPYNFEKIENLHFEFEDADNIGIYYVEIADNNRFYEPLVQEIVEASEYEPVITDFKAGQYFLRVRCQKGEEFGPWAKAITFTYQEVCKCDEPEEDGPRADAVMPSAFSDLFTSGPKMLDPEGNIVPFEAPDPKDYIEIEDVLEILTTPENGTTGNSFIFEFNKSLDPYSGEVIIIKKDF